MFILFKLELFKLRKKLRAWLGPILVFLLITISFPLTVELDSDELKNIFVDRFYLEIQRHGDQNELGFERYFFRGL